MSAILSHDEASKSARNFGFAPQEPYPGGGEHWLLRHGECGHLVEVKLDYMKSRDGRACPYCHGKSTHPDDAMAEMRAAGWVPEVTFPGTLNAAWPCVHRACGERMTLTLNKVRGGTAECRRCAGVCPHCDGTGRA